MCVCACVCVCPNASDSKKKNKNNTTFNGTQSVVCAALVSVGGENRPSAFLFFRNEGVRAEKQLQLSAGAELSMRVMRDFSSGGLDFMGEEMCRFGDDMSFGDTEGGYEDKGGCFRCKNTTSAQHAHTHTLLSYHREAMWNRRW